MMPTLTATYRCPDGSPFTVDWPDERDSHYGWRWDQMHGPLPVPPLCAEMRDLTDGFKRTADVTGSPAYGVWKYFHGYGFARSVPFDGDPAVREAVRLRDMERRMDCVLELWHREYRPEVEGITRALRSFADPDLSLRELVDGLEQVHALRRRQGELHMLVQGPGAPAYARLIDFCVAEYGADGERLAAELTQGLPNKSLESAEAMWELANEAKARPAVAALLHEQKPADFLCHLAETPAGTEFHALLLAFLHVYGDRNESFFDLSQPTWRQDPRFPLFILRRYLDMPEDAGPGAMHGRAAQKREQRQREVEARLADNPEGLAAFRAWLPPAQHRTILLEDHNFYIDQQGMVASRIPCLAIGRHLVAQGTIDAADDVFYLIEEEIKQATVKPDMQLAPAVAERRAERERWLRILPPAVIGEGTVAMNDHTVRFFGPMGEEPKLEDGSISGVAASPGVVRGTARLLLSLDDVDRLAPGEILVTYATAPPWTPLFAVAAAVVTDAGGSLSHCAVVAREYGIPAVVGTRIATRSIPDGAVLTVDGSRGVVTIEA